MRGEKGCRGSVVFRVDHFLSVVDRTVQLPQLQRKEVKPARSELMKNAILMPSMAWRITSTFVIGAMWFTRESCCVNNARGLFNSGYPQLIFQSIGPIQFSKPLIISRETQHWSESRWNLYSDHQSIELLTRVRYYVTPSVTNTSGGKSVVNARNRWMSDQLKAAEDDNETSGDMNLAQVKLVWASCRIMQRRGVKRKPFEMCLGWKVCCELVITLSRHE